MGYKLHAKIRIDLGDLGDNNGTPFFVEIKNPRLLTMGDREKFKDLSNVQSKPEDEQQASGLKFMKSLITSWNLMDVENEQPINLSDENALSRVPIEVITRISGELRPKTETDEATKNSSEQSVKS